MQMTDRLECIIVIVIVIINIIIIIFFLATRTKWQARKLEVKQNNDHGMLLGPKCAQ